MFLTHPLRKLCKLALDLRYGLEQCASIGLWRRFRVLSRLAFIARPGGVKLPYAVEIYGSYMERVTEDR